MYRLEVVDIMVHKWSNEDGQGEYVCNKGGYHVADYSSISEAIDSISDDMGYTMDAGSFCGEYIQASRIENDDAYQDEDGGFIADYTYQIFHTVPVRFNNYD